MDASSISLNSRILGDLYASENNRLAKLAYECLCEASSNSKSTASTGKKHLDEHVQLCHLPRAFALELTSLFGLRSNSVALTLDTLCTGIAGMAEHHAACNLRIQERANAFLRVNIAQLEDQYTSDLLLLTQQYANETSSSFGNSSSSGGGGGASVVVSSPLPPFCTKVITPLEKANDEARLVFQLKPANEGFDKGNVKKVCRPSTSTSSISMISRSGGEENEEGVVSALYIAAAAAASASASAASAAASSPPPVLFRTQSLAQGINFMTPPTKLFVRDEVSTNKLSRCFTELFVAVAGATERGIIVHMKIGGQDFTTRQELVAALDLFVEAWIKTDVECQQIISLYLQRKLLHACQVLCPNFSLALSATATAEAETEFAASASHVDDEFNYSKSKSSHADVNADVDVEAKNNDDYTSTSAKKSGQWEGAVQNPLHRNHWMHLSPSPEAC